MATIQIRNLSDEAHDVYKERAQAAGMSLQEFMRERLEAGARTLDPAEWVNAIDAEMAAHPKDYAWTGSSAEIIRELRDAG